MTGIAKIKSKADKTVLQARAQKWAQSGVLEFELPYEEDCVSYMKEVKFPIPYNGVPKVFLTIEMEDENYFGAEAQLAWRHQDSFAIVLRNLQNEKVKGLILWRSDL
jgi:hypothetical protein